MSDQPPKPKPGSLRDRIAAFENKGTTSSSPGPPPPRPKPTSVQWKPRAPSPPAPADNNVQSGERKGGGMSASDAMESIGRGSSLKERMAALQGKGAFGGPPPPVAPKPNVDRPKWKPPPSVPAASQEDEPSSDPSARDTSRSPPPRPIASPPADTQHRDTDVGPQEGDGTDPDPEEEERQRRAAIAARMARLGGARFGMAPPVFAPKPVVRKQEPPPEVKDEGHADHPAIAMESDQDLATLPPHDLATSPDAVIDSDRKDEPPVPSRTPASMPVPAGPRRAAPPRKKSSKNAPTTALPEPPVEEADALTPQSPPIVNEPPRKESLTTGDSQQEIADVAEAIELSRDNGPDITAGTQPHTTSPLAPTPAFHEPAEGHQEQETEEELVEGTRSHVAQESMHTAPGEQEYPEQAPETEEGEGHQLVAAQLTHPFSGRPPLIPSRRSLDEPAPVHSEAPIDVEDEVNVDTEEYGVSVPSPPVGPPRHDDVQTVEHDEDVRVPPHFDGEHPASERGHPWPTPEICQDEPIGHDSVGGVTRQGTTSTLDADGYDLSGTDPLDADPHDRRLKGDTDDSSARSTTAEIERDTSRDEADTDDMPPPRITRPIPPPPVNLRSKPTPPSSPPISPPPPKTPSHVQALRVDEQECPPSPDIPPRPVPPPGRSGSMMTESSETPPPPPPPPRRSTLPPPRRASGMRATDGAGGTPSSPPPVPISPRPVSRRPDTPPIITTMTVQEPETRAQVEKEEVEAIEEDNAENVTPRPESPEGEEGARRRAIAERMARLGGIRFGGPPMMNPLSRPPLPAAPPPTSIPPDEMEHEEAREHEGARGEQEEQDRDEEEAARKQRIAAKLAGMGGLRIGMLPPPVGARRIASRQEESESEDAVPPVPVPAPLHRPVPTRKPAPPIEAARAGDEAEEHVRYSEESAPRRRSPSREALPTPPPRMTSRSPPPVRPIPTALLGRLSSATVSRSRQASLDETRSSVESALRPSSEYVLVEAEDAEHEEHSDDQDQERDAPPALPPPRSRLSRGGSTRVIPPLPAVPPPSAIDAPEALSGSAQWELPSIPQGVAFGDASEMGWVSEDSGAGAHGVLPASSSSLSSSQSVSVKVVGLPSSGSGSVSATGTGTGVGSGSLSGSGTGSGSGRKSLDQQPSLTNDELIAIWGKTGVRVVDAATALFEKSKKALVGDGSHPGFVRAVLAQVPGALCPPDGGDGADEWGHVVYVQTGNAVQRRVSDIMPGDVIAFWDARFKGHKGLAAYTRTVDGALVGVVNEVEHRKSKVRVWQANQHVGQQTVECVSYRLEDLKSGQVKVYRVLEARA